jgi:hypothetical protein
MRTYSQRGGAEALRAAASAKNEPLEYDFGAGLGVGTGMDLDTEYDPDPNATVRKKKRTFSSSASTVFGDGNSPRSSVEPPLDAASGKEASAPLKSELKPPKLAPSTWQLYFTDWIQRHQLNSDKKLNVAQAAKEAGAEYANLTPEQKEVRSLFDFEFLNFSWKFLFDFCGSLAFGGASERREGSDWWDLKVHTMLLCPPSVPLVPPPSFPFSTPRDLPAAPIRRPRPNTLVPRCHIHSSPCRCYVLTILLRSFKIALQTSVPGRKGSPRT